MYIATRRARLEASEAGFLVPQKGTGIGHFGGRDDPIIRMSKFLMK